MTRVVVQRGLGTSTQSQSRNAVHAPPTSVPAQQPSSQPLASSPPQQEAAVRSSDFPNSSLSTDDPSASSTSNAAAASSVTILIPEEAAKRDRVKDGNEHESGATIQPLPLSQDQSFQSSSTCEPASRHESSRANSSQHISEPPRSSLSSSSSRRGSWTGVSAAAPRPGVMFRRPSRISPTSNGEGDGYNSADESGTTGFDDEVEGKERHFENELRRVKGFELRRMAEDGNCLFRALADQVYGDPEMYDETRQMCIDYMEKERDHFSQFVTESFTAYCKRKRRDKVYGNNLEIQAMAEMYNRPIHIHCYSTDPINIFHGHYETDLPPIRLSYHRKNHYNSLHDPSRPAVGAGLGFGSLRGGNVDREQVKAAIRAQQEQQIDKALVAEGRYYSDLEVTEQEIERMVMEASRAEYLAQERHRDEACSAAAGGGGDGGGGGGDGEPSSSRGGGSEGRGGRKSVSSKVRMMLSMGFSYVRVVEACSIFGDGDDDDDDVNNMLCYLLETDCGDAKNKGKAAAER